MIRALRVAVCLLTLVATVDQVRLRLRAVPAPAGSANLLATGDITYDDCYYDLNHNGGDTAFLQALTHHFVSADLRFLNVSGNSNHIFEYTLSGKNCGDLVTTTSNSWVVSQVAPHNGLWHDATTGKTWHTLGVDYETIPWPGHLNTMNLGAAGSVTNLHTVRVEEVVTKRMYGGCQRNPAWFISAYGVEEFACGWGGYTSLQGAGGGASLGLTFYTIDDPADYAHEATIPSSESTVVSEHVSGTGPIDWFTNPGHPFDFDRSIRTSGRHINYFDDGDDRENPLETFGTGNTSGTAVTSNGGADAWNFFYNWFGGLDMTINGVTYTIDTYNSSTSLTLTTSAGTQTGVNWSGPSTRPTFEPVPAAGYLGDGPDGKTRWTWGDSYYNNCNWIDGDNKDGFVCIASLGCGFTWYASSSLHYDNRCQEIHIYDPEVLGQGATGAINPWNVQPTHLSVVTLPGSGCPESTGGNLPLGGPAGTTYVASTKKLYVQSNCLAADVTRGRLYRFSVDDSAPPAPAAFGLSTLLGGLLVGTFAAVHRARVSRRSQF